MPSENIAGLDPGSKVSLDIMRLWQERYEAERGDCWLECEGYIHPSPEDDDDEGGWDYPYLDIYTDAGPVACDGETATILSVDEAAQVIELRNEDTEDEFLLSFDDAALCARPI